MRPRRHLLIGFLSVIPLIGAACVPDFSTLGTDAEAPDGSSSDGPVDTSTSDARGAETGDDAGAVDANGGDTDGGDPLLYPPGDAAGCQFTMTAPADLGSQHVAVGTPETYSSEPASSGPHYGDWSAFKEFTTPVPAGYYVHDLEHGAVVFAYRCPSNAPCDGVQALLRNAAAAIPDDPTCNKDAGVRIRYVIMPDPLLDVPIAAVAWTKLYKATCIDLPSLKYFATSNYGKGLESRCDEGTYR